MHQRRCEVVKDQLRHRFNFIERDVVTGPPLGFAVKIRSQLRVLDEEPKMVRRLSNSPRDQVQIRLLLGNLQLPHSSIDLFLGTPKLFPKDREVQQAHYHEQQRSRETKHADQRLDPHSVSPQLCLRLPARTAYLGGLRDSAVKEPQPSTAETRRPSRYAERTLRHRRLLSEIVANGCEREVYLEK